MELTKLQSTLISSNGRDRRCVKLEYPVPKSSSASSQPLPFKASSIVRARLRSSGRALSVISIVKRFRSKEVSLAIFWILFDILRSLSWTGDILKERVTEIGRDRKSVV